MKLYGYYQSSTTFGLRIALNLKGVDYDVVPINLVAGEQQEAHYSALNRFQTVPALEIDGRIYVQSMAILQVLDELFPEPPLLPIDTRPRQTCRELAFAIGTEIHAPNNLAVLNYLRMNLGADETQVKNWYATWVCRTFGPVEASLVDYHSFDALPFGDRPSLFEIVLVPQIYNARRFGVDLSDYPKLLQIEQLSLSASAFAKAHPDNQPDSQKAQSL